MRTSRTTLFLAAVALSVRAGAQSAAPVITYDPPHCEAVLAPLGQDQVNGLYEPEWDESAFWAALRLSLGQVLPTSAALRSDTLARYLIYEDGFTEPLRTGREVDLYRLIKQFVATHSGQGLLTPEEIFHLSMRAVRQVTDLRPKGISNEQVALLTAHNVVRILARPEQWTGRPLPGDVGHPPTDPVYPVLQDLLGKASVDGGEPLPQILVKQGKLDPLAAGDPNNWATNLFQPNGPHAIFRPLPGTTNALNNGGSHYYFWVGALGYAIFGQEATDVGFWRELVTKQEQGIGPQGEIQVANGRRGRELARCLEGRLTTVEAAVDPTPGIVGTDLRLRLKIWVAHAPEPANVYVNALLRGPGFPGTVNQLPPAPISAPYTEITVPARLDRPGNYTWKFDAQVAGNAGSAVIRGEQPATVILPFDWSGRWQVSVGGNSIGILTFRKVSRKEFADATQIGGPYSEVKVQCGGDSYLGQYDYSGGGKLTACPHDAQGYTLSGRYKDDRARVLANEGDFQIVAKRDPTLRFEGTFTPAGQGTSSAWSGVYLGP